MAVPRRVTVALAAAAGLAGLLAGGVELVAGRRLARRHDVAVRFAATAPAWPSADSALLARGEHLAGALGRCGWCHGDDLGGAVVVDDPGLGRVSAPNLTRGRGGVTAGFTMADWDRAIRHGLRRDGRGLVVMPADDYALLSDRDLTALVAYLRQLPPVDREMPRPRINIVGRALYLAGRLPLVAAERIDHLGPPAAVTPAVTAEYGTYLADIGGCRGCHGPRLGGGPIPGMPPGTPPATDITPSGIGHYSEADFFRAMRDGVRPDGTKLAAAMPVRFTRLMSDGEMVALHRYLRTVLPRGSGLQ